MASDNPKQANFLFPAVQESMCLVLCVPALDLQLPPTEQCVGWRPLIHSGVCATYSWPSDSDNESQNSFCGRNTLGSFRIHGYRSRFLVAEELNLYRVSCVLCLVASILSQFVPSQRSKRLDSTRYSWPNRFESGAVCSHRASLGDVLCDTKLSTRFAGSPLENYFARALLLRGSQPGTAQ
jgi:hypothetical protein